MFLTTMQRTAFDSFRMYFARSAGTFCLRGGPLSLSMTCWQQMAALIQFFFMNLIPKFISLASSSLLASLTFSSSSLRQSFCTTSLDSLWARFLSSLPNSAVALDRVSKRLCMALIFLKAQKQAQWFSWAKRRLSLVNTLAMVKLARPWSINSSLEGPSSDASEVWRQQSRKEEREEAGERSMCKFNLKRITSAWGSIAAIIDNPQKMGNCEKSMYHERQKNRQQEEFQARQTPQPSEEGVSKEQSANQNIAIPTPVQQPSRLKSAIKQEEAPTQTMCKLISNYGQLCTHPDCKVQIVMSPRKPQSPSKLRFQTEEEPQ